MAEAVEVIEAKEPLPEADVPGVRGPLYLGVVPQPPQGHAITWGGEGGAGVYRGAPVISDAAGPVRPSVAERGPAPQAFK
jgi:hypothetical protein